MSFRWTSMSLKQVTFARDEDNAVTVLVLGAGGGSGAGGGATTFLQLADTPAAYAGQGGRAVRVNAGATGLEFFDGGVGFGGAFADLTGIPTTLAGYGITDAAGLVHTHVIADVTGLQAALDAKAAGATVVALVATVNAQGDAIALLDTELDGKSNLGHTHIIGNITGLQAALDGKAALSHTHAAADIVSGVMATARLGSGTPGSGNFLRGDGTWASLPGGSASWGAITGTLASQADLQAVLDAKLNASAVSAFGATLIDDADAAAARTTLGLGTAATAASSAFEAAGAIATHAALASGVHGITAFGASLVDDANAAAARTTLGLGGAAVLAVGTTAGTVAAGDDSRLSPQTITLTGNVTGSGTGSFAATIANNAVTTARINDAAVTLAKMANLAADRLIGRATASTGVPEAITCTAAGRALLDDADAAAQRTTLGLGTAATQATGAFEAAGAIATHAGSTSGVHGISAFGATLVDDANAAAARTTLGLGGAAVLAVGTTAGTVCAGDDTRLSDARTPLAHNQDATTINTGTMDRSRLPTLRTARTIILPEPVVGDRFGGFTRRALTLQQLSAVLVGSSTPSVGWTLRYAADRSAAGTAVVTAGTTTTTTTTAQAVTSFNNAVIPADNFWWLEVASVSGTVVQIEVTLDAEEAA